MNLEIINNYTQNTLNKIIIKNKKKIYIYKNLYI